MHRPAAAAAVRGCAAAVLGALPVFLAGCVAVLIAYQIRLGYLQAASTGFGGGATEVGSGGGGAGQLLRGGGGGGAAAAQEQRVHDEPARHQHHQQQEQHEQQQQDHAGGPGGPSRSPPLQQQRQHHQRQRQQQQQQRDTLVVYIFNEDDPVFTGNFEYFLLAGVQQDSRCAYVVIVHERALKTAGDLPAVPGVTYLYYGGPCYEWGMLGWMLGSGLVAWRQYERYVLVSSAVRGPFLPTYLQGSMHWTEPLLSRLTDRVKLVGPLISCVAVPPGDQQQQQDDAAAGGPGAPWRHAPHLPFHALATDRVGLDVLLAANVTACHTHALEEKHASEQRAAVAMFEAGYSIDCLLIRYQGVDWSNPTAWDCNRGWDPSGPGELPYDGTYLDPMEVVFARLNSPMLEARAPAALKALKYSQWAVDVVAEAAGVATNHSLRVAGNAFHDNKGLFKLPRILTAVVRGMQCFDVDFFVERNRDLFGADRRAKIDQQLAWKFFVYIAQFEDRPHRYTCACNYSAISLPAF